MRIAALFAGIGGLERGLHEAGHETMITCEIWEPAVTVLASQFPLVTNHPDVSSLVSLPARTELLTAGFPCQDLSQAGLTAGIAGRRSGLVDHVFRLLDRRKVPIVVLENVSFMLQLDKGAAMDRLTRAFEERGYRWAYRTVNSLGFLPQRRERVFFVASRGHHADIGGSTPGSMPPFSKTIDEEGVLFDNFLLVREGVLREAALAEKLRSGPWPARNPEQTTADLRAQIAANEKGVQELRAMVAQFGRATVAAYMKHVQDNAEESVRRVITALKDGQFALDLDNGARITVKVTVQAAEREATIDFTGTSPQLESNFNAPLPVVRAAVLYVIRTLIDEAIPMNEGCLRPIEIIVPQGCFLNPRYPAAVVAGNVETSQAITDALFGALGAMAAAQGTMNNFTFGNEAFQYYETIAGGSGAGPDFDGTDVVQTHMTNSRLTDPEILETRFPVLLEAFAIRPGSGGVGAHHGGNGAVRRIRFRQAMDAGILSNRRRVPPFGLSGGASGAPGRNSVERADGSIETLGATAAVKMAPGDVFVIETPGGGGFGREQG